MLTELPSIWKIKNTRKEIGKYFSDRSGAMYYLTDFKNVYLSSHNDVNKSITDNHCKFQASFSGSKPGAIEITFEDFQRLVLNQSIELNYEIC